MQIPNGVPADQVPVTWRKSKASNPTGACVEVAPLPHGDVAVRNSRHPSGPALVYTGPRSPRSWPGSRTASLTTWADDHDRTGRPASGPVRSFCRTARAHGKVHS